MYFTKVVLLTLVIVIILLQFLIRNAAQGVFIFTQ